MNKIIASIAIASFTWAATATAGNLVFEAPVEQEVMVEEAPMGSNAAWIIPLLAVGLIAIAVSSKEDEEDDPPPPINSNGVIIIVLP